MIRSIVIYSFIFGWLNCYNNTIVIPIHGFQTSTTIRTNNGIQQLIREINHNKLQLKRVLLVAITPPSSSDDTNNIEVLFHSSPLSSSSSMSTIDNHVVASSSSSSSTSTSPSYFLTKEESHPIIRIGKNVENEKIINMFGIWCLLISLITGPLWMCAMYLVNIIYKLNNNNSNDNDNDNNTTFDPHRAIYDQTGKIWSKVWLSCINSYPTISGNTNIISSSSTSSSSTTSTNSNTNNSNSSIGPCLYVANHSSWLDIPILCTVLDSVFKFIAKGELRNVPCIGQQLHGGNHILIDRDDRKSQLRTFKDGIAWLQKGVPIMAFPEGMRSSDGRLIEFKKGLFSLAVKANVPIVPITLSNTYAIMPMYSYFPVQSGAGKVHVHIGEPIYPSGKTEKELEQLVRNEFIAHLPPSQLPLNTNDIPTETETINRQELVVN